MIFVDGHGAPHKLKKWLEISASFSGMTLLNVGG